jgi:hypothetical protein
VQVKWVVIETIPIFIRLTIDLAPREGAIALQVAEFNVDNVDLRSSLDPNQFLSYAYRVYRGRERSIRFRRYSAG